MSQTPPVNALSSFERFAVKLLRKVNEEPLGRSAQRFWQRQVGVTWMDVCTRNLLHAEGVDKLRRLNPDRGVLLCANHRSFFDQFVIGMTIEKFSIDWAQDFLFPVRSNYFYETWGGILVNLLMGGGALYPPVFRDPKKAAWNRLTLDIIIDFLREPGHVVGYHPEGTRGKGPDPYQLLPAQPGVGQVALRSGAMVIPIWINGLTNDFVKQITSNFRKGDKRGQPIIIVYGDPVDLSRFAGERPRPAVYKRVADAILADIKKLGERERVLRAEITGA